MKKNILLISGFYSVYFIAILASDFVCHESWCRVRDDDVLGQIFFLFLSLLFVFFFSLVTYKMRDEVFQAWWRFARWFVPVIVIVTFLQNGMHQQSGFGGVAQGAFDFLVLVILYTVFIAFSLAKIIGTSIKLRKTS